MKNLASALSIGTPFHGDEMWNCYQFGFNSKVLVAVSPTQCRREVLFILLCYLSLCLPALNVNLCCFRMWFDLPFSDHFVALFLDRHSQFSYVLSLCNCIRWWLWQASTLASFFFLGFKIGANSSVAKNKATNLPSIMATFSHSGSRRLYSWWWNSHISPKNSKWLEENLAGEEFRSNFLLVWSLDACIRHPKQKDCS